jgi:hypothetical protein
MRSRVVDRLAPCGIMPRAMLTRRRATPFPQVRTMERVQQIKESREKRFWDKRMEPNKALQKERDLAEVDQGLDLVMAPMVQEEAQQLTRRAKAKTAEKA